MWFVIAAPKGWLCVQSAPSDIAVLVLSRYIIIVMLHVKQSPSSMDTCLSNRTPISQLDSGDHLLTSSVKQTQSSCCMVLMQSCSCDLKYWVLLERNTENGDTNYWTFPKAMGSQYKRAAKHFILNSSGDLKVLEDMFRFWRNVYKMIFNYLNSLTSDSIASLMSWSKLM